jgi:hypothetical protein
MQRTLVAAAVLAAALTSTAGAPAATSPDKLAKQVAAMTKRVTALEKKVKTLETQNRQLSQGLDVVFVVSVCSAAITADALQGTWTVIDQIAQPTLQKTFFGPQVAVNDPTNACNTIRITRTPVQANIAPFSALFALLAS